MSYYDNEDSGLDLDEADDEAAARNRRRGRQYSYRSRSYVPPRPRPGAASNVQVTQAFDKVGGDVRKVVDDIGDLESDQGRLTRQVRAMGADLQQFKMLSVLLPLLNQPASKEIAADVVSNNTVVLRKGDKVALASNNSLTALLPVLLLGMGGNYGNGGPGGGGMGGDGMGMLMPVILIAALTKQGS